MEFSFRKALVICSLSLLLISPTSISMAKISIIPEECTDGNDAQALSVCTALIESGKSTSGIASPDLLAQAHYARGRALLRDGKSDEALLDFVAAVRLNPQYYQAYNYQANINSDRGNYREAINLYTKALAINPDYGDGYFNRGRNYAFIDELELSIADQSEAIRIWPEDYQAYNSRGVQHSDLGNYDLAEADFI